MDVFRFKNIVATHCVSTRVGGVSSGVYATMNLGAHLGDTPENVAENFKILRDGVFGGNGKIVRTHQTHGTNIALVDENTGVLDDVDGLITNVPGLILTTYFADCVPLLFYDPVAGAIGNAHAGWRGCAENMAEKMVNAMTNHFGSKPCNILVGIGPSISAVHFQVGQDVVEKFKNTLPFSSDFVYNSPEHKNKFYIDLWQICCQALILAGISPENIEVAGLCTFENKDLFFSHRRDGLARGSMVGMICL